jgi:hypothetical protein
MPEIKCFNCQQDTGFEAKASIFRSTECPHCQSDLRCCSMCVFFDATSYNQCRESQADRITEKTKANFCGFFEFGTNNNRTQEKHEYLNAAESLFKK